MGEDWSEEEIQRLEESEREGMPSHEIYSERCEEQCCNH